MKKNLWDRLFTLLGLLTLVVAVLAGLAGSYLLGSVFGMGMPGYAFGFLVGLGIVLGGFCFDFNPFD